MSDVVFGIDIGGTNTVLGLVDQNGKCLHQSSMKTESENSAEQYFKRLFEKIELVKKEFDSQHKFVGIGVGAPNANYYSGYVENPPNLNWDNVNVVKLLKDYTNLPTVITNDANAAALGEMEFGAAKGMKNFVEITLGTGLGSGIIVNSELVYGHDGFAGEIGHTIAVRNGRECGCGRYGCLETYASATGIKRTLSELISNSLTESSLAKKSFSELTAKNIYDAAVDGDRIAQEAFKFTGDILGASLADTAAHLSPEAFILFGGLASAGELLFKPTIESMERNILPIFKNKIKILPSKLVGSESAVLGAGAIIWHELHMMN